MIFEFQLNKTNGCLLARKMSPWLVGQDLVTLFHHTYNIYEDRNRTQFYLDGDITISNIFNRS